MEKKQQFDLMQKVVRELEDLKNSQTSVLKKLSQIEADNIQINNKTLENILPDIHESVDESLTQVSELHDTFSQEVNDFKTANEKELAEDPTAAES